MISTIIQKLSSSSSYQYDRCQQQHPPQRRPMCYIVLFIQTIFTLKTTIISISIIIMIIPRMINFNDAFQIYHHQEQHHHNHHGSSCMSNHKILLLHDSTMTTTTIRTSKTRLYRTIQNNNHNNNNQLQRQRRKKQQNYQDDTSSNDNIRPYINDDDNINDDSPMNNFVYVDEDDDNDDTSNSSSSYVINQYDTASSYIETKSHFYSQKSIHDPSFRIGPSSSSSSSLSSNDQNNSHHIFEQLCHNANIIRPSKIQSIVWPILVQQQLQYSSQILSPSQPIQQQQQQEQHSYIIADQTGSGKTYAYLLPLLQRIIIQKQIQSTTIRSSNSNNMYDRSTNINSSSASTTSTTTITAIQPQVIIVTPTAELADQIYMVCQQLARSNQTSSNTQSPLFTSMVVTATGQYTTNIRQQIRYIQQQQHNNIDVIIATPGRLATILRMKHCSTTIMNLQSIHAIVFDEIDILLVDDTFTIQLQTIGTAISESSSVSSSITTSDTKNDIDRIIDMNDNHNENNKIIHQPTIQQQQFIFVTATLPDSVIEQIQDQFRNTIILKGPGLHRIVPTITEHLIDVSVPSSSSSSSSTTISYNSNPKYSTTQNNNNNNNIGITMKANAVQHALRKHRCQRTIIFCNTISSCRIVENLLYRMDRNQQLYTVFSYHNALSSTTRNSNLQKFIQAGKYTTISTSTTTTGTSSNNNKQRNYKNSKNISKRDSTTDTTSLTSYILICTDRAARGIDFSMSSVDHVILYDFPIDPAEYVRRIGRTGRAGRTGTVTVLAYGWQLPIARSIMKQQHPSSKLITNRPIHNHSIDANDEDNDKYDDEYMGGVIGRKQNQKQPSSSKQSMNVPNIDQLIGENIAYGKLWNRDKDAQS